MINYRAACLIIDREMNLAYGRPQRKRTERLRVMDEFTRELDWGWVIYFGDSDADVELVADEPVSKFPPCLVDRQEGRLFSTGKSWPLEKYMGDFEMQLLAMNVGINR